MASGAFGLSTAAYAFASRPLLVYTFSVLPRSSSAPSGRNLSESPHAGVAGGRASRPSPDHAAGKQPVGKWTNDIDDTGIALARCLSAAAGRQNAGLVHAAGRTLSSRVPSATH